jgi:hypothetical protein
LSEGGRDVLRNSRRSSSAEEERMEGCEAVSWPPPSSRLSPVFLALGAPPTRFTGSTPPAPTAPAVVKDSTEGFLLIVKDSSVLSLDGRFWFSDILALL